MDTEMIENINQHYYILNKELVEDWCKEANYKEPVGFYNNMTDHIMYIHATKPGFLIGYQGKTITNFIAKLNARFNANNYKVEFIEIKGGMANY